MKKYVVSCIIILFALFSCTQTKEDVIRSEFKDYVIANFDDPQSLREIVSIEQIDTVSYEGIRIGTVALLSLDSLVNSCVSFEKKQSALLLEKLRAHRYPSYYEDDIRKLVMRKAQLGREMIAWLDDYGYSMVQIMSDSLDRSLKRLDGLCILEYKIKVRVKDGEDLKLKDYYALEDSVGFRFFDKAPTFYDYSEGTAVFYKVAREYEDIIEIRKRIVDEQLGVNKEIQRMLY